MPLQHIADTDLGINTIFVIIVTSTFFILSLNFKSDSVTAIPGITGRIVKLILTSVQVDRVKIMESVCRDQISRFTHHTIDNPISNYHPSFLKNFLMKMQVVMNAVRRNSLFHLRLPNQTYSLENDIGSWKISNRINFVLYFYLFSMCSRNNW